MGKPAPRKLTLSQLAADLAYGYDNKRIAKTRGVSVRTVESRRAELYRENVVRDAVTLGIRLTLAAVAALQKREKNQIWSDFTLDDIRTFYVKQSAPAGPVPNPIAPAAIRAGNDETVLETCEGNCPTC